MISRPTQNDNLTSMGVNFISSSFAHTMFNIFNEDICSNNIKGGVKGKERSKFEIFSQDLIYLIHEKR